MSLKTLWSNLKIKNKIFVLTTSLIILTSLILFLFMYQYMPKLYHNYKSYEANNKVTQFVNDFGSSEEILQAITDFSYEFNAVAVLKDATGRVIYPTMPNFNTDRLLMRQNIDSKENIKVEKDFYYEPLDLNLTIQTYFSFKPIDEATTIIVLFIPFMSAVSIGLSLILSFFYSRMISKPIVHINKVANKMAHLDFSNALEVEGKDEINELCMSLNEMSQSLKTNIENLELTNLQLKSDIEKEREIEKQRREFIATISHELKSPLTIMMGQLEGMSLNVGKFKDRDMYLRESLQVANEMKSLVNEILSLSKLEDLSINLNITRFNLGHLVKEILAANHYFVSDRQLDLSVQLSDNIWIESDRELLKRALSNIIINALTYTPSHKAVQVMLNDELLMVKNYGICIEESELDRIFQAFYRVEKSRNRKTGGSGLGLYIVKTILDRFRNMDYALVSDEQSVTFTLKFNEAKNSEEV